VITRSNYQRKFVERDCHLQSNEPGKGVQCRFPTTDAERFIKVSISIINAVALALAIA
jgi:hypothetical protein